MLLKKKKITQAAHICYKKQNHPISTWVVHEKYKNKKHPVHGYKLQTIKES